jgi:hypothetical protein
VYILAQYGHGAIEGFDGYVSINPKLYKKYKPVSINGGYAVINGV